MSREDRQKWAPAFQEIGVQPDVLYALPDDDFLDQCKFIQESGIECPNELPKLNHRQKPQRTNSGQMIDMQNQEYDILRAEMIQKEKQYLLEQEKQQKIILNKEKAKQEKIDKANNLGPQPANGVTICALLPSGKRLIRKFNPTNLCDELFTLIEGQPEMFNDLEPFPFKIVLFNKRLQKGVTFTEAGIKGKTMVNVVEDDDD